MKKRKTVIKKKLVRERPKPTPKAPAPLAARPTARGSAKQIPTTSGASKTTSGTSPATPRAYMPLPGGGVRIVLDLDELAHTLWCIDTGTNHDILPEFLTMLKPWAFDDKILERLKSIALTGAWRGEEG